ncbi:uncharacterized protein MYCFIDRAFT_180732 [Pseudocercospora fijiensis CIRAD86]|uniref:Uncharacterized protein n=1 Tax=Pseudocercospora fijiensis (strain CIRAD86) TaxID=383855 RepID=M2YG21_PSEFD|nr:uncharacterized protein MYCFIDRAFT_180732 [Pseudocercospora fijiensis CIRAD86]EME76745.1 hypothetical protein MYCFIDRAFT_180732 [Pseudocercospora fijiensis CIRAD86]
MHRLCCELEHQGQVQLAWMNPGRKTYSYQREVGPGKARLQGQNSEPGGMASTAKVRMQDDRNSEPGGMTEITPSGPEFQTWGAAFRSTRSESKM